MLPEQRRTGWPWWRVACGVLMIALFPVLPLAAGAPDWFVASAALLGMVLVLGLCAIVDHLEQIREKLQ